MEDKKGIEFLFKAYPKLIDDFFPPSSKTGNLSPFKRLERFLEKLDNVQYRAQNHKDSDKIINLLKEFYYNKYVTKKENIDDSYFQYHVRIQEERGISIDDIDSIKEEEKERIIKSQKESLDKWIDYFLSSDANVYPMWLKVWAFQGMVRLGDYDYATGNSKKRRKNATTDFLDLNREALALILDYIQEYLKGKRFFDTENSDDILNLLEKANFGDIYFFVLKSEILSKDYDSNITEGVWKKYLENGDHIQLSNSLMGYGTGWCTRGYEVARQQLSLGDFYIYYSKNNLGEYSVPRIAIRMENNSIAEIRGVEGKDQNLEENMLPILEEKLTEFPDRDKYKKKVSDMERLTQINIKNQQSLELTKEELEFLYEIKSEIIGFGYEKDPRIEKILNSRKKIKDFSKIFECNEEQICTNINDLNETTICYIGAGCLDYFDFQKSPNLRYIPADLNLSSLTSAEGLDLSGTTIGGSLYLSGLTSAEGLDLSGTTIHGHLYLSGLTSAEGLDLKETTIGGSLDLSSLTSAEGLDLKETTIGGYLYLSGLTSAEGLDLKEITIDGDLGLSGLTSAEGLNLKETTIGGDLYLSGLTSAEGLDLKETTIGGDLYLSGLTSAEGLDLKEITIGGSLNLKGLTSAEGLNLKGTTIGGYLNLSSLTSAEGLDLSETTIGGTLYLRGLTSAEGLDLSETTIGGTLYLSGLTSAKGLENLPLDILEDTYTNDLLIMQLEKIIKEKKQEQILDEELIR